MGLHPDETVFGGNVTLDYDATVAHVGLSYTPVWQCLPIEAGGQDGPALSKKQRISQIRVLLHESLGGKFGPDSDNMDEILYRTPGDALDTAVPLYNGYKVVDFRGDNERDAQIRFEQHQAFPVTIVAIFAHMHTWDRG